MVPKGDYDSEKKVLGKIEKLDYVNSALGLANVAINDDYMLTDKLNPRQFAELTDLDVEVVQILYTAYAYNEEQYGRYLPALMIMRCRSLICSCSCMTSIRKDM